MIIKNCKFCGYAAVVYDDCGIGDVMCSNPCCSREHRDNSFHYSGKFNTKKKEAIRQWNLAQEVTT